MSSVSLLGDTSGSVLLQAPAIAGSPTVTLPTQTGTLALTTTGTPLADYWYVSATTSLTADTEFVITSNLAQLAFNGTGVIGTMSQSSGVFTFPQTGLYRVAFQTNFYSNSATARYIASTIKVSTDGGSNYTPASQSYCSISAIAQGSNTFGTGSTETYINVTSTTNVKVMFSVVATASGINFYGGPGQALNGMTFNRLGNSV